MGEGGVGLGSAHDPSDGEAFLQRFKLFLLSPLKSNLIQLTTRKLNGNRTLCYSLSDKTN